MCYFRCYSRVWTRPLVDHRGARMALLGDDPEKDPHELVIVLLEDDIEADRRNSWISPTHSRSIAAI